MRCRPRAIRLRQLRSNCGSVLFYSAFALDESFRMSMKMKLMYSRPAAPISAHMHIQCPSHATSRASCALHESTLEKSTLYFCARRSRLLSPYPGAYTPWRVNKQFPGYHGGVSIPRPSPNDSTVSSIGRLRVFRSNSFRVVSSTSGSVKYPLRLPPV